ncbi:hypothetical protein I3842_15G104100 [Carya illinoinensis]|uniref:Uncharacterized protein n=1 Tax=Carya illinoinensis TaxID=32201 RepID=A0A922A5J5_CARIL|nr:hypothetical protein I3842_15G104100 [Carya illinoinensis]
MPNFLTLFITGHDLFSITRKCILIRGPSFTNDSFPNLIPQRICIGTNQTQVFNHIVFCNICIEHIKFQACIEVTEAKFLILNLMPKRTIRPQILKLPITTNSATQHPIKLKIRAPKIPMTIGFRSSNQ